MLTYRYMFNKNTISAGNYSLLLAKLMHFNQPEEKKKMVKKCIQFSLREKEKEKKIRESKNRAGQEITITLALTDPKLDSLE